MDVDRVARIAGGDDQIGLDGILSSKKVSLRRTRTISAEPMVWSWKPRENDTSPAPMVKLLPRVIRWGRNGKTIAQRTSG
jgi:hypothetical protein